MQRGSVMKTFILWTNCCTVKSDFEPESTPFIPIGDRVFAENKNAKKSERKNVKEKRRTENGRNTSKKL